MDTLFTSQSELRHHGFQALTKALGGVNAVRFFRLFRAPKRKGKSRQRARCL